MTSIPTPIPDLTNQSRTAPTSPVPLPRSQRVGRDRPEHYLPDSGLLDAFKVMLLLRRPLLVTGEPGTGKTQAANYLNWKLGLGPQALRFDAKTTSTARDLFYSYNAISRFHAAQTNTGSQKDIDYIQYNALGAAIIRAMPYEKLEDTLPPDFAHSGKPAQSVVLIDEVDKAPRDFPNDLLNELENLMFRVPELQNREFRADPDFQPLVVVTSNSEKNLPAAFLRRCVFYNIPKPTAGQFALILQARLDIDVESPLVRDVLDFIMFARGSEAELSKIPATAELIDFVLVLRARGVQLTQRLKDIRPEVLAALAAVIKGENDSKEDLLQRWLAR
jgi:MoxR-like ATPase